MSLIWGYLFGCTHRKFSFPLTVCQPRRRRTYVVCLRCGREFEYDWERMRVAETREPREPARKMVASDLP